jgi:DNA-binding Lrp family transcriptional regulator
VQRLDDLDTRIIRELGSPSSPQWNVRESYSRIAGKLGVDEETVRRRLKRAKESGWLPRWRMIVNPHLLGLEAAGVDLVVAENLSKAGVLAQIRLVDGVLRISDFQGRGAQVNLYYPDEESLQRKVKLFALICWMSTKPTVWKVDYELPDMKMVDVDWKLVEVMEPDARMDLQDVAKVVGVSVRTVQRRLALMREGKAVYIMAMPNFDRLAGIVCNFLLFFPEESKKKAADKLVLSETRRIDYHNVSSKHHSTFVIVCENPSEAERIFERLKKLDGVETVRMGVIKEAIGVDDWLLEMLRMHGAGLS